MKKQVLQLLILGVLLVSCKDQGQYASIPQKKVPDRVDYNFDVRPILSDKCFNCHGPDANKRSADLRLDTPEGAYKALKDSENEFVIVPRNIEKSMVYQRITTKDSSNLMPPLESNLKLSDYEIKVLKKWIEQGAVYDPHWAFIPVKKPKIPNTDSDWVNNEIDHFVLDKLSEVGLEPNEIADKERLLKRVSLDITGLPPTPEMRKKFISDNAPDAYGKIVDELLSSPHYGEKMASHWLDVARYADSHGFQNDQLRTMWPWRDWVIHAFNENYSYKKFVTYQLAGDLMPTKNIETILATGFNRNHKINQEAGIIEEEFRIENVTDRTNTFGKAFLGLTLECAKCHDHKYDPISQKDYFSTFAFFDKVVHRPKPMGEVLAEPPLITLTDEVVEKELPFVNKKEPEDVEVMVIEEKPDIRTTHLLNRGVYDDKGEIVQPSTPESVLKFDTLVYDRNRLGLTKWLFDEKNPLTSRVFVNRVWQEIFGEGIVRSSGDFGMQGDLPTHIGLLNWLSADFMENDWDMKRLVKQIVMSSTYRQSSVVDNKKLAIDPDNRYLSHMTRLRFTAETIRDHALATSGLLNDEIGGRSVKVYQPDGIWEAASSGRGILANYVQDHGKDLYRRGIYIFIKRTTLPPVQLTFDAATRDQCEVKRQSTMTPLQALIALNDPTILEAARVLSESLIQEKSTVDEKIEKAFERILCRSIKPKEKEMLVEYYQDQEETFANNTQKAKDFIEVGEYPILKGRDEVKVAALMQIVHTIYNLEETIVKG
ncbi:PSD1 and planctomycete cytochrome C domain-containing protein [Zobellia russellii]|uniref:PSD1 and planctomycete cytochrome C domain-containing protein n=2 Tax=Zobellia TaxID=112040 RepID=UPI001BFF600F|nr:PSD1 and planctomycete cytochrome C domain-containing protein [Zobellia russellii]MBT9188333.1 PSD1 domain-containing protein [Zobellia russellii]